MATPDRCSACGLEVQHGQNFCVSCGAGVVRDRRPHVEPLIGQVLCEKYEVESVLGAGSMGVVYRARHLTLGNDVAIKVLRRRLVSDETVVRRFKQEARAASRLSHPNTIQILDFGELDNSELFMAMEYVDGRDLAALIQQEGPLPAPRTAHIFTQVCSALYEAHDNGIVHRDLKPANVLVANLRSQRDFVKVLDFGIAKMLVPDPSQSIPMTRAGFVCGTPAFMSPEQVQGFDLDGRSDLFALGICLYQVLTGKLPFTASTPLKLATALVTEDPVPPHEVRPDWSPDPVLSEICMRAMQKKPEDRYSSALAVIDALAQVRSEPSRSLIAAVARDPVVTEPDLPAVPDQEQTRRNNPALTPADHPNRAHLDLPPAERKPDEAENLQTMEVARRPTEHRRNRTRTLVLLAGAALAGFVVVTLALDRFASTAPVGKPTAPMIQPDSAANAKPAAAAKTVVPSSPRVEGVLAPAKPITTPPKMAKKKVRGGRATPARVKKRGPAAAPPAQTARDRVRRLHAQASAALRMGDQKGSIKHLKAAIAIDPRYAPLHRDLGKLYMRRQKRKKGLVHYKRYVKLSPKAPDAKAYKAIIKRFK